jgi:hypothetical protein
MEKSNNKRQLKWSERNIWLIRITGLLIAAGFIIVGINRQEVRTVLVKAIRICLECIGLG